MNGHQDGDEFERMQVAEAMRQSLIQAEEPELLFSAGHVCIDTKPSAREGRIAGRLSLERVSGRVHLQWMPYSVGDAQGTDIGLSAYAVNMALDDLSSVRRKGAWLFIIHRNGTTPPPFYFENGNPAIKDFMAFLQGRLGMLPSPKDSNVLTMSAPHDLMASLHELGLEDAAPQQQPKSRGFQWNLLERFARVTRAARDMTEINPDIVTMRTPSTPAEEDRLPINADLSSQAAAAAASAASEADIKNLQCRQRADLGELGTFDLLDSMEVSIDVELCVRGQPVSMERWRSFFNANGQIEREAELREAIFRGGLGADVRPEAWKYLMGYWRPRGSWSVYRQEKEREYRELKMQWQSVKPAQLRRFSALQERFSRVQKDVRRTDRDHPYFAGEDDCHNLKVLNDVLVTYSVYNFDLGYVQGMSDLLSVLLIVMDDEVDSFWCFANLMDTMEVNFSSDQRGMSNHLRDLNVLIRYMDPVFMDYLDQHDSGNLFFAFRWLLIMFKREFEIHNTMRLWEVVWSEHLSPRFYLFICLALVEMYRDHIMTNKLDFDQILGFVNSLSYKLDVDQCLVQAEMLYYRLTSSQHIPDELQPLVQSWSQRRQQALGDDDVDRVADDIDSEENVRDNMNSTIIEATERQPAAAACLPPGATEDAG